ncbi:hypothetical protein BHU72_00420 [Desulfuribacillus stibiiarsenatis]|uniref:Uncharacterized protein n=1 Tax=Desulfuribacillus stibiiarsenatis TaxID=1390249 RepID=A0A1E5L9W7_9FIRM|nr:hypothetical protein [Desulfuribacillus stibiiarsenatis]OEH86773.1 hypothetical protein BHU72_00420 [Desulfuribacillus stibiiarsenatis]
MEVLLLTILFFSLWVSTHIGFWNFRQMYYIPSLFLYFTLGLSTVGVVYFIRNTDVVILYFGVVLGTIQGNQEAECLEEYRGTRPRALF